VTKLRAYGGVRPADAAKNGEIADAIMGTGVPKPSYKMKMDVAICAAGVFYTEDGGRSWQPRNCGTRADFLPNRHPELGQCVRKLLPAADGTRLYQQNHCDAHWKDFSRGWRDSAHMIR
jgi:hypothetical protein